jgi:prepilin-type N-terminal cleavage/methylation domain-containing protein
MNELIVKGKASMAKKGMGIPIPSGPGFGPSKGTGGALKGKEGGAPMDRKKMAGNPAFDAFLAEKKMVPSRRRAKKWVPVVPVTMVNAKPKKGFTLIEILVGIGLLTIILAISTPYVQKQAINANLRSAARQIESDIFDLKQRALSENTPFAIIFDSTANNYTIQQGGASVEVRTLSGFGNDVRIVSAPFGGGATLAIQTGGTTTAGNVNLANGRGSTAILTINIAGRTYVQFNML